MKRLILCADGTWNQADQIDKETGKRRPTNVTKIARAILPRTTQGINQIVFYHDGIGTSGGALDRHTDGAFGHGMEDHIRDLYRFLVFNYVPGDEIYLFGFSRGAFTVRSLAGFLHCVGLLEKDDDYYTPELYQLYEKQIAPDSAEWNHAHRNVKNKRPAPPIHFIGVWDTVGALGAPGLMGQVLNRKKYQYHRADLNSSIRRAYHALALDERRKPFAPTLFTKPAGWIGELIQAWFSGVHTNIGGGYDPDGLANEALHWIVKKATAAGIAVDSTYLGHFEPHYNSKLRDSMTLMYYLMGPIIRPVGDHAIDGERIHVSAQDRFNDTNCGYTATNLASCLKESSLPIEPR